jgi:hypothetical protein
MIVTIFGRKAEPVLLGDTCRACCESAQTSMLNRGLCVIHEMAWRGSTLEDTEEVDGSFGKGKHN